MNAELQKLFSINYSPDQTDNVKSGASSVNGTLTIRQHIENVLAKHNIKSIFDAGCNDCGWMSIIVDNTQVVYHGGDISLAMVAHVWKTRPKLDMQVHDATTDPFPPVDLLFVRDVSIHLNNVDKKKLWQNWLDSNIPWILITHEPELDYNQDTDYTHGFPIAGANWLLEPWNFPQPIDQAWEYKVGGRCMALWHQSQFDTLLERKI
jgi:hypothetical protein